MRIRKPAFNARGGIDCEVNDPLLGWIPFSASPDDPEIVGGLVYDAALAMGPAPYVPPAPPTEAEIDAAVNAKVAAMMGGSDYATAVAATLADLYQLAGLSGDAAFERVQTQFKAAVAAALDHRPRA